MTTNENVPYRRAWYHGWNIIAACTLAQIAGNGISGLSYSLFLPGWTVDLHTSISVLQLPWIPFAVLCGIAAPMIGLYADKLPARWVIGVGLAGMAVFNLAVSLVTAAWQLVCLYTLLLPFAVTSCTAIPVNALVARWFVRRVGVALGLAAVGLALGGVILPPIVASLLPVVGWRAIWRGAALLTAFVVLPTFLLTARNRPSARDGQRYLGGGEIAAKHSADQPADGAGLRGGEILRRRNFWLILGVFLPILSLYVGILQNLVPISTSLGFSQRIGAELLSITSAAHIAATVVLGLLSDRFGNRLPFSGVALTAACGVAMIAFGRSFASLAVGSALVGVAGGTWPLLGASVAVEFGAANVGRAYGLLAAFVQLYALAPFFVAKTQESTGSYKPALLTLCALALLGGAAFLTIHERRQGSMSAG
jgi:MFS family permease